MPPTAAPIPQAPVAVTAGVSVAVPALSGLDLLATAVILVDNADVLRHMNPAAENLLELSHSSVVGQSLAEVFADHEVLAAALQ